MLWALIRDGVTEAVRRHFRLLHVVFWTLAVLVTWVRFPSTLENFRLISPTQQAVDLPYSFHTGKGTYVFEGTLNQGFLSPRSLVVRVDDCLESASLDGKEFLTTKCNQCDHCPGTRVELPADIPWGPHKLSFRMKDHGGLGVFTVREASGLRAWAAVLFWLLGLGLMTLCWKLNVGTRYAWSPLSAMVLALVYGLMTDPFTRQHDVDGHREYIEHLLNKRTMPGVKQGWETWQPPLYYALNAVWVAGTRFIDDTSDIFLRVQAFSALLYVLCVCIAALYWKRFNFNPATAWFGVILFAWMPAHLYVSARVNNDALTPLLGLVITILSWEYMRNGRLSTVFLMSGVLVLSLTTKTSSLSLVAGSGLSMMACDHLSGRRLWDRLARMLVMGVPMALWMCFWMWRNHEQTGEWLYVNAQLQDALKVANTAYKYLSFDYRAFISENSFSTFGGKMRESFPTSLAASLLTGYDMYLHEGLKYTGQKTQEKKFLDAVMRHELPDVHLVLAVRDDQAIQLGLVDLLAGDCGRTLKPFPRRQWRWLANEYLQAKKLDRAAARASIAHLEATLKTDFEPRLLSLLAELMTLEGVGR